MAAGWLDQRSSVLTGVAVTLAMIAATVVAVYLLGPVGTSMWVNAVVGVLVLAGPLVTRPPLTHQRLGVTAVFWFCVGLRVATSSGRPCSTPASCSVPRCSSISPSRVARRRLRHTRTRHLLPRSLTPVHAASCASTLEFSARRVGA